MPVLVADQGHYKRVFGLVPASPLRGASTYRATFTWKADREPRSRIVVFDTQ